MSPLSNRARAGLAAGISLATIVLAVALREQVRELIVLPMVRFAWMLALYVRMVPQWILWAIFLTVALYVAIGSLLRSESSRKRRTGEPPLHHPGPVEAEMRWIRLASAGSYGRWRLAQRLAGLAAQVQSHRSREPLPRVKRRLAQGEWLAPSQVKDYVEAGLGPPPSRTTWLVLGQLGRHRSKHLPLATNPERIIAYIEKGIEGTYGE